MEEALQARVIIIQKTAHTPFSLYAGSAQTKETNGRKEAHHLIYPGWCVAPMRCNEGTRLIIQNSLPVGVPFLGFQARAIR